MTTGTLSSIVKLDQENAALNERILQSTLQERDAYKNAFERLAQLQLKTTPVQILTPLALEKKTSDDTLASITQLDKANAVFSQSILSSTEQERDAYKNACERLMRKLKEQPQIPAPTGPSLEGMQRMTDRITHRMEAEAQAGTKIDPNDRPSVFLNLIFLKAHQQGIKIDTWKSEPPTQMMDTVLTGYTDPTRDRILNLMKRKIAEIVENSKKSHEALYAKIKNLQDGDTRVGVKQLEADIDVEFERFLLELSSNTQSSLVNHSFPCLALNLYALWYRLNDLRTHYLKLVKKTPSLKEEIRPHLEKAQTYLTMIRSVKESYFNLLESSVNPAIRQGHS